MSSEKFSVSEKFALTSQIRRAAISICLNIAEGSNKGSNIDFSRYLSIRLGSLEEVVACLDIALDEKYISLQELQRFLDLGEGLGSKIISFKNKLRAQSSEPKA